MTDVCVYKIDSMVELEVKGHADYAERGKDIVCAAVSTICYTMLDWAKRKSELLVYRNKIDDGIGYFYLRIIPKAENEQITETVTEAFCGGFRMLSECFPENVRYMEKVGGK